jgi:hypothetical protein
MRKLIVLAAVFAVALPALAGDHPAKDHMTKQHPMKTESGWFDFENCVFCKNLVEDPGLLPHATWESHKIDEGAMFIMTVAPEYADAMDTAMKKMEKVGQDMETGKLDPMSAKMCGSCMEYGQLMMAGVKMENVEGDAANVTIMTSSDPALVKRLHKMVDRNKAEMAMMMGGEHGHGEHPEHPHH